jgi:hypothetical protein
MRRRPDPPLPALIWEELNRILVQHQIRYIRLQEGGDADYEAQMAEALNLSTAEFLSKHENDAVHSSGPTQPPTSSQVESIPIVHPAEPKARALPEPGASSKVIARQPADAGEIEAVVRDPAKLRTILAQLPGVNARDERFTKFSRI